MWIKRRDVLPSDPRHGAILRMPDADSTIASNPQPPPAAPRKRAREKRRGESDVSGSAYFIKSLPPWARIDKAAREISADAFFAGAGLAILDQVLRAGEGSGRDVTRDAFDSRGEPPFTGVLRQRLALAAAATSARLARLREDRAALRDAEHLAPIALSPELSPAARLHRLWRLFASPYLGLDAITLRRAAELIGLPENCNLDALAEIAADVAAKAAHPLAAATNASAAAMRVLESAPSVDAENLALFLSDLVLAERIGWKRPIPLLATAIAHPSLRRSNGQRPRPSDPDWAVSAAAAYARAAFDAAVLAVDLARRSERLLAATPILRAKGALRVVEMLLADDAVAPARAGRVAGLSDRASRRLFERLVELNAVRELSGRQSFRLYGL